MTEFWTLLKPKAITRPASQPSSRQLKKSSHKIRVAIKLRFVKDRRSFPEKRYSGRKTRKYKWSFCGPENWMNILFLLFRNQPQLYLKVKIRAIKRRRRLYVLMGSKCLGPGGVRNKQGGCSKFTHFQTLENCLTLKPV